MRFWNAVGTEPAGKLPSVSVVIPCLDDAGLLEACLQTLGRQTRAPLEVIVVDNGCTDDSARVAARFGARVIPEATPGIPAAACAGYDAAFGDIIARCDADSLLPPEWIGRIAAAFAQDPRLTAVTGMGTFALARPAAQILSFLYLGSYYLFAGAALGHWPLFGSNMAVRAASWQQVRGQVHRNDKELHDDLCLSFHLGPASRIRLDPSLQCGMSPRAIGTWAGLRLRFRRGLHTLAVHWAVQSPGRRWQARLIAPANGRRT
ncbi:glycosyltransferase family A protein [Arthrobacter alkaliphilus]|uniref:glycosyltransferase family A protein n=1 Tax=Arthrobacter alkaliphilus TaxID=369936 RepID=UPI001F25616E|nr:glycosyltransferase family A protein [Arthrobacter alkaliphilus]